MEHLDSSEVMDLAEGDVIDAGPLADANREFFADDPGHRDSVVEAIENLYFEVESVGEAGGGLLMIYAQPHNIVGYPHDIVELVAG